MAFQYVSVIRLMFVFTCAICAGVPESGVEGLTVASSPGSGVLGNRSRIRDRLLLLRWSIFVAATTARSSPAQSEPSIQSCGSDPSTGSHFWRDPRLLD